MTWVRIDDSMPHHPKVVSAGPDAFVLDVAGLCYSSRFGTDGFIADQVLHVLSPLVNDPQSAAARLVDVDRWTRDEQRLGYLIHDFTDYQPTAAQAQAERERRRIAGQRGAAARWGGKNGATANADAMPIASDEPCEPQYEDDAIPHRHVDAPSRPVLDTFLSSKPSETGEPAQRGLSAAERRRLVASICRTLGERDAEQAGKGTHRGYVEACVAARVRDHGSDLHALVHGQPGLTAAQYAELIAPAPPTPTRPRPVGIEHVPDPPRAPKAVADAAIATARALLHPPVVDNADDEAEAG